MDDLIQITPEPLDVAAAVAFVSAPSVGGINVFLGTTRAERHAAGHQLVALDYEAYLEMATQQLQSLGKQAREHWPIENLAILHRVGRVAVAEPSVIIAVATPHRAESFDACRFLIDRLKAETAIWKKEVWSDGTGTWVHP